LKLGPHTSQASALPSETCSPRLAGASLAYPQREKKSFFIQKKKKNCSKRDFRGTQEELPWGKTCKMSILQRDALGKIPSPSLSSLFKASNFASGSFSVIAIIN
jgi:hypothetical protein